MNEYTGDTHKVIVAILKNKFVFPPLMLLSAALVLSCSNAKKETEKAAESHVIKVMTSEADFNTIVENAGSHLLVFDMYTDWCKPCKMLSPILEAIAEANTGKAAFYKINVDEQQGLAQKFNVSGIPFVMFIKNKTVVESFTGLQPQDMYQQTIDKYATVQ